MVLGWFLGARIFKSGGNRAWFRHISWQTAGEFGFVGRLDGKRGVANKEAGAPTKCRPLSSLSPANRPHVFGTFVANRKMATKCACVCHSMRLGTVARAGSSKRN